MNPIVTKVLKAADSSGLSDREIARRAGVSPKTLYFWRQEVSPSVDNLCKVSGALRLRLSVGNGKRRRAKGADNAK